MTDTLTIMEHAELSTAEQVALRQNEEVIKRGVQTFYEVGNALADIRERRLYRAEYATFEDYCTKRWGFASSRARQLIGGASVVSNLKSVTTVTVLPINEAQARPLASLSPEKQVEVWQEAVQQSATGQPTAKQIEEAARYHTDTELMKTHRRYDWNKARIATLSSMTFDKDKGTVTAWAHGKHGQQKVQFSISDLRRAGIQICED